MWRAMWVIIALTAIVMVSGCTQTGQVTEGASSGQDQPASQCTTIQESYEAEVPYNETECSEVPYESTEPYEYYPEYRVVKQGFLEKWSADLGYYHYGTVTLENEGVEAAWFIVTYTFMTIGKAFPTNERHFIGPGEQQEYEFTFDSTIGQDVKGSFEVEAEPVTLMQTITEYRTECQEVTRYTTETKYREKQVCG